MSLDPGLYGSVAYGVADGQQVGYVGVDSSYSYHAALWSGTAASFVDLNPAGLTYSQACGVSGGHQVGSAAFGGREHAALWSGTAASWVDLSALLPAGVYRESEAEGIYVSAGEIWVTGWATTTSGAYQDAMLWHYVPEPSSLLALAGALTACAGLAIRRSRVS